MMEILLFIIIAVQGYVLWSQRKLLLEKIDENDRLLALEQEVKMLPEYIKAKIKLEFDTEEWFDKITKGDPTRLGVLAKRAEELARVKALKNEQAGIDVTYEGDTNHNDQSYTKPLNLLDRPHLSPAETPQSPQRGM